MKKLALMLLYIVRSLVDSVARFREVAVLCYHSISQDTAKTTVAYEQFVRHLDALEKAGYSFVPLSAITAWQRQRPGGELLPRKAVALTFDDGYADFAAAVLPLIAQRGIPVTLFVLGSRDSYRPQGTATKMLSDRDLEMLALHPLVELGWHTQTHLNLAHAPAPLLSRECTPEFPARYFAYPGGNYSDAAIAVVERAGFEAAFSIKRDLVGRNQSVWLLPRIVIECDDAARDVLRYVSMAQRWYTMLRRLIQSTDRLFRSTRVSSL